MAGFLEQFQANQIREWADNYLDYRELHAAALKCRAALVATDELTPLLRRRGSLGYESSLDIVKQKLEAELDRVDRFFATQLDAFSKRWMDVKRFSTQDPKNETLRAALIETYRAFLLLQTFASLNIAAASEVAKELRQLAWWRQHPPWRFQQAVESDVPLYCSRILRMYADTYHDGDGAAAEADLTARRNIPALSFASVLQLGLFIGMCIPLAILALYFVSFPESILANLPRFLGVLPLFRAHAVLCLTMWLWGCVTFLMERLRLNYIFIMELNPATVTRHHSVFKIAALFTALWLSCFVLFVSGIAIEPQPGAIPPEAWPVLQYFITLAIFFCPFNVVHRPTRLWILRQVGIVMAAPLVPVTFSSNFAGDYLTSMVKVISDIGYSTCVVCTGSWLTTDYTRCVAARHIFVPIVTLLPLFWRMMQCLRRLRDTGNTWPHLANFGKYFTAVAAVTLGVLHQDWAAYSIEWPAGRVLYVVLLVLSTLYGFLWDIFVDWGLLAKATDPKSRRARWNFRRTFLTGHHTKLLLLPMGLNLVGRCAWMYTIAVATPANAVQQQILVFITAMVEVARRCQWSFFRLSNEHWNNVGQYRVVKEVPLLFSANTVVEPRLSRTVSFTIAELLAARGRRRSEVREDPPEPGSWVSKSFAELVDVTLEDEEETEEASSPRAWGSSASSSHFPTDL